MNSGLTHLIINSPYEEPKRHWLYHRETQTFSLQPGRRPAGYIIASESSRAFDDPGRFVPIEIVNQIRPRVEKWRAGLGGPWDWRRALHALSGGDWQFTTQMNRRRGAGKVSQKFLKRFKVQGSRFRVQG
jgi:hypothetical protein